MAICRRRTSRSATASIAARIPGAELRLIPGAGHGYFLERPDAFNALSLEFIARSSRKS